MDSARTDFNIVAEDMFAGSVPEDDAFADSNLFAVLFGCSVVVVGC